REAVRRNIDLLQGPIDVILHPRRSVIDLDFATLDREVAQVFRTIQKTSHTPSTAPPPKPGAPQQPESAASQPQQPGAPPSRS
ncbi:MAG TPA: hypothetical protein VFS41_08645, partial [Edaphobacter sp.]|nr:hypothetical protein [Edaphobacter sp.]